MKSVVEKIKLLKDETIKKRFRILTRKNKDSPAAHYGCVYHTFRKPDVPYPVNEIIIVFSKKLTDKDDKEKVIADCVFWGQNHGEMHMALAVKPLIEKFFENKEKRDAKKQEKYDDIKKRLGVE